MLLTDADVDASTAALVLPPYAHNWYQVCTSNVSELQRRTPASYHDETVPSAAGHSMLSASMATSSSAGP